MNIRTVRIQIGKIIGIQKHAGKVRKIQILTSWIQLSSSAVDPILLGSKDSEETLVAAIKIKQAKYITKDIGDSLL